MKFERFRPLKRKLRSSVVDAGRTQLKAGFPVFFAKSLPIKRHFATFRDGLLHFRDVLHASCDTKHLSATCGSRSGCIRELLRLPPLQNPRDQRRPSLTLLASVSSVFLKCRDEPFCDARNDNPGKPQSQYNCDFYFMSARAKGGGFNGMASFTFSLFHHLQFHLNGH